MSSPHQSVPPSESSHTAAAGADTGGPSRPVGGIRALRGPRGAAIAAVLLAYLAFVVVGTIEDWSLGMRIGLLIPALVIVWLIWPARAATPTPGVQVIGITRLAYLGVVILSFCVFFAFVGAPAWLWWLLVLPVLAAYWVTRTHTTVSAAGLDLSTMFGRRHLDWSQVRGIRIPKRGYVRVHLADDSETALPAVGYDRLRELVAASDGRLPDVFAAAAEAEAAAAAADDATAAATGDAADNGTAASDSDTTAPDDGEPTGRP